MTVRIRHIRAMLVVAYVLLWFGFGLVYQRVATTSAGKSFVFQEDLRTEAQIRAFKTTALYIQSGTQRGRPRQPWS